MKFCFGDLKGAKWEEGSEIKAKKVGLQVQKLECSKQHANLIPTSENNPPKIKPTKLTAKATNPTYQLNQLTRKNRC